MERIAFYAPLKSPDHPVPSGDRELATGIQAALTRNGHGYAVELVSQLRSYDGHGDIAAQRRLKNQADLEISRLLEEGRDTPWKAWVTYHNYYKAPDLIGPAVCQQLSIPYILIEASVSARRRQGPWADFAALSDLACAQADIILYLTERDREALTLHRHENGRMGSQKIEHFPPFLNQDALDDAATAAAGSANDILAVGMLRATDKFESYRIIADVLPLLATHQWRLSIVGDGPAREAVESLFESFGGNVIFHGQLDKASIAKAYRDASVFLWPGVNEAFGMVYLEAQAAGLPVVAQDRPGVREVVAPENALVPQGDAELLASNIDLILASPSLQLRMADAGREFIRSRHLLGPAATALTQHLASVVRL